MRTCIHAYVHTCTHAHNAYTSAETGTGKTRTMLGTEASLQSTSKHDDWGVFPRVCSATFDKLSQMRARGQACMLLGSALEFYLVRHACMYSYAYACMHVCVGPQVCVVRHAPPHS